MDDIIIEEYDEVLHGKDEDIMEDNMKKNKKEKSNKKRKNNKKRLKKLNLYLLIVSIIWIVLIFINTFLIFKYDVLPFKYLIIYLLIIVVLPILLMFLATRKKINKGIKVFISIIGIIYIILLSFAFFYINNTFNFIKDFTSGYSYETKNYLVLVLNDSEFSEIKDLENEKIGYVNPVNHEIDEAISKLDLEIEFEHEEYDNYSLLFTSLDNKDIEGVLIGDSYYQMLSEEDSNFKDKYRTIYSFSLTFEALEVKKDADVTEDVFNIYISGIDSYGSVNSLTRSDVNIVASINPKTNQILLINIPRDYYVEFPGTSKKDKLTHAGIYGIDMSINTVEELLDIEINYYFKVNYNALIKLVDALGGVDVYSKYTFTSGEYYFKYQKGYNHVNGIQALEFVRTRKAFKDGDRVRGENQQAMIKAIIKKAISPSILTKYSDILNSLKGTFATNMGIETITDLIKLQLDKMPSWNIVSKSLNGSDGSGFTYTYPHQELYVMIPNQQTIDDIKQEIEKNMQDEVLDASIEETSDKVNTPTVNKPVVETKEEVDSNNDESFTEKEPVVLDENINQNDNSSIDNDKGTNEDDIESNLTE